MGGCSGVIIRLNSVQLQMQLPAGTELGNNGIACSVAELLRELFKLSKASIHSSHS